jgi:hypothetical protein
MKGYSVEVIEEYRGSLCLEVTKGRHKGRILSEPKENLPGAVVGDKFILLVSEDRVPFRKVTR